MDVPQAATILSALDVERANKGSPARWRLASNCGSFLTPNLVGIVGLRTDIRIVPALPLRRFSLYFGPSSPKRWGRFF